MSARPPLDAAQLAETIDTIGLLVASLSDRVDAQGRILEKVHQTATEARAAAFAAERATDWKRNGDLIDKGIAQRTQWMDEAARVIQDQIELVGDVFELMKPLLEARWPEERKHREKLERLRRRIPALLAGAIVTGIGLGVLGGYLLG